MKEQYGDYLIEYSEDDNKWIAKDSNGEEIAESKSLKALKQKLDGEKKEKYPRLTVYKGDYQKVFIEVEITSKGKENSYRNEVWITHGKERHKVSANILFLKNEKNKGLVNEIISLSNQIDKIKGEISLKEKELDKFDFESYKPIEE